ncbi:MAG: DUF2325 domain-containing protein [Burkholderiales bacterium]|nr:MAG: DUF2325 domain-containing protein [Burkholderiales bacterium]
MRTPPFRRALDLSTEDRPASTGRLLLQAAACCDDDLAPRVEAAEPGVQHRAKLHQLDPHLHCSVLGTCLTASELRKLMTRHMATEGATDLDIHHTAVGLAAQGGDASKALHKALDQRHAGAVRTFAAAKTPVDLAACWQNAWQQGEIQGAYWAVLTHKLVTPELRQTAFGAVHMLSHLMGSANRHEMQRFVALEKENAELHQRLEREQARRVELQQERDQFREQALQSSLDLQTQLAAARAEGRASAEAMAIGPALISLQVTRRERAEEAAETAAREAATLKAQVRELKDKLNALARELAAAEDELHASAQPAGDAIRYGIEGKRLLYVGGRPSSTPSIRDFVARHGGEFLHHDGGIESRKGLLAAQLPKADLVVFPVDCIDHDSALQLKRLCEKQERPYMPLRSASLASLAAALRTEVQATLSDTPRFCLRHG